MKNKILTIFIAFSVLALMLTSCSGSASTATSWGGATVTDSAVYFANGSQVLALRSDNDATIWTYPEKVTANRSFLAAPVLAGDQLILADTEHFLTSINRNDGVTQNWQFTGAKGKYIDSPLVVGETIVAPNADNSLYALDFKGAKLWVFTAKHSFWAQPVSDGKLVFAPNFDHYLYAVDVTTGAQKWKTDLKASLVARATLVDGVIYIGNLDGDVFAVDSAKGTILWQQKVAGGVWAAPVVNQDLVYFSDQTGIVNILKAADGSKVKAVDLKSAILGAGVVLTDGIVFGKENGDITLIGFDGSEQWTRTVGGSIYSNLATNGNLFVVVATKGDNPLVAFDKDGKQSWAYTTPKK
jgi:eukaryotic-like serine/threonine-protein kinase